MNANLLVIWQSRNVEPDDHFNSRWYERKIGETRTNCQFFCNFLKNEEIKKQIQNDISKFGEMIDNRLYERSRTNINNIITQMAKYKEELNNLSKGDEEDSDNEKNP